MIGVDANSAPAAQSWTKKNNKMEEFNITTTIKKFGDRNSRVEVTVFEIELTEEDAGYLKTLMLIAY
eukprot:3866144-Ditylum_brightwellii.AAC.1